MWLNFRHSEEQVRVRVSAQKDLCALRDLCALFQKYLLYKDCHPQQTRKTLFMSSISPVWFLALSSVLKDSYICELCISAYLTLNS